MQLGKADEVARIGALSNGSNGQRSLESASLHFGALLRHLSREPQAAILSRRPPRRWYSRSLPAAIYAEPKFRTPIIALYRSRCFLSADSRRPRSIATVSKLHPISPRWSTGQSSRCSLLSRNADSLVTTPSLVLPAMPPSLAASLKKGSSDSAREASPATLM